MLTRISQNQWDLDQVLPLGQPIGPQYFHAAPIGMVESFKKLLSRDVFSEADAQVLYDYLMDRQGDLSPGFLEMLKLWRSDELKHYEALRRIYHSISGVEFEQMDQLFRDRVHETEPIALTLTDEFTILVTMMFDEIGSVYSYRRDLVEYYSHFGPAIRKIGHHLVKDEGMHFSNAAELLLGMHDDRLDQVAPLLQQISDLENSLGTYYKTFFLDHAQEQFRFPPQFNAVIIRVILARLGLGPKPEADELKALWQWVPTGHDRVPIAPNSLPQPCPANA
jgi:rubrerythrin